MSSMKGSSGFSLIEILVVTFILALTSGVIAILLSGVLRGSNKAQVVGDVTKNGNYALSVISDHLRNSEGMLYFNGVTSSTTCPVSPAPPAEGARITIRGFDKGETTFACVTDASATPPITTIASQSGALSFSLIDLSTVEVDTSVTPCASVFLCSQLGESATPRVTIQFTLKNKGTENFFESRYSASFKTDVLFRNAIR